MEVIKSIKQMQASSEALRREGKVISFVPTMGYFHDGHLNLMKAGRERADCSIISIYVNPTQFGPGEDFEKYPRDFERDAKLADSVDVDIIFNPSNVEMYPDDFYSYVNVEELSNNLCGSSRPGHFKGVTTICMKLFNLVKPHITIFGKKDFQQLTIIKKMVQDLNMDIDVIGLPTTREKDGLAMSSRNIYLKGPERESALSLSRSLLKAKLLYEQGERDSKKILTQVMDVIGSYPQTVIDYAKICDTTNLKDLEFINREAVLALAVKVGTTRLIDNYVFGERLDI